MNTKIILMLILIVGGVVAATYFTKEQTGDSDESEVATTTGTMTEADEADNNKSGTGTLGSIATFAEPNTCTFTGVDSSQNRTEGTFYVNNGQVAVEAVTRIDGELFTSNMINDGDQVYVWTGTSGGMMAIVMDADVATDPQVVADMESQSGHQVDLEQTVTYSCSGEAPGMAKFVPPTNIQFVDMELMMQGYYEGSLRGTPEGLDF